ncbi:MAG: hypothetical protein Kow0068_11510 [Marinilabiliales bacterium]
MNKLFKLSIFSLIFLVFFGCKEDNTTNDVELNDTTAVETDTVETVQNDVIYKFPNPVELYMFLWEDGVPFNSEALHDLNKAESYVTTESKAINFGIYASDLAYCTVNDKNEETFNYFTTVKQLANDLGLLEGFDDKIAERIDKNISNSDSLFKISVDSYSDVITQMENNHQDNLLPFIITGSWLESVYIAVNSTKGFSEEDPVIMRVVEQQMICEMIAEYLETKKSDPQVNELLEKIYNLLESYDKLYDNTDVLVTKEQYQEISEKIINLRNELTK